jgi:hypothetical protein
MTYDESYAYYGTPKITYGRGASEIVFGRQDWIPTSIVLQDSNTKDPAGTLSIKDGVVVFKGDADLAAKQFLVALQSALDSKYLDLTKECAALKAENARLQSNDVWVEENKKLRALLALQIKATNIFKDEADQMRDVFEAASKAYNTLCHSLMYLTEGEQNNCRISLKEAIRTLEDACHCSS